MLICKVCSIEKQYIDFPIASVTKTGRAGECKECKSARTKKLRSERETLLYEMLLKQCNICKMTHKTPSFFDFHHVDKKDKHREVKQILCGAISTLLSEVKKCVMLCPNCHRETHIKEGWK